MMVSRFLSNRLPKEVRCHPVRLSLNLIGHAKRILSYSPEIIGCSRCGQYECGYHGKCDPHCCARRRTISTKCEKYKRQYQRDAEYEAFIGTAICHYR